MQRTIFDSRLARAVLRPLSVLVLRARGWRLEGEPPDVPRYVLIAAPHTSNWDLVLMLLMAFAFRVRVFWMGKHTLFRAPGGPLLRWLGGIPIDRSRSQNVVEQCVAAFRGRSRLVLAVPPEATRARARGWRTGFYHIAVGAGVPIALGFLDWGRKVGGFGPLLVPTGDLEADLDRIRAVYAPVRGRYPDQASPVAVARPAG